MAIYGWLLGFWMFQSATDFLRKVHQGKGIEQDYLDKGSADMILNKCSS